MSSTTPITRSTHDGGNHQQGLAELQRRAAGTLHVPGDPTWDEARRPWAVLVEQTPLAVLEVRDADDVRVAVRWAADRGVQVSAQPVGHGATGPLDQVLLLRTRALGGIEVDVARRTARIGAGVKAGELLAALDGTGLSFLAGSNPDPSVVGMTITGGISWFGRAYGLGANSILSVELVDGLGRVRHVSAEEDPELFWALRGGGGDFGIITRLELRLHPVPQVYGGRLLWPVEQMDEVLRAFAEVTAAAPPELSVWFHAYRFPPFPEVPEPLRGRAFASVAVAFIGDGAECEPHLAAFRRLPVPVLDLVGDVPLAALGTIADEPVDPTPSIEWSTLLTSLDDDLLEHLVATVGADSGSPLAVVQLRHLGAAFSSRVEGQGAAGHVEEPFQLFAVGIPGTPELGRAIEASLGRLEVATARWSTGRALLNFVGAHGDTSRCWTSEVRERLGAVKRACDPLDTLRSNRPVRAS